MQLFSKKDLTPFSSMRNLILSIFLFSIAVSYGQDNLKKVTVNDRKNHLTESYTVKKPGNVIKQGTYELIGGKKNVLIEGNYANNNRTGVWKFYSESGELVRQFNFDRDSLVEYKWNANDSTVLRVKTAVGWMKKEVSSPPFPLYGDLNFIISRNLQYPAEAKKAHQEGRVVVSVHIDRTGVILGYRRDSKASTLFDEEALRVVKLIDVWYPAICEGKKTECEYLIPVEFKP